jgi:hypothetical protein
MKGEEAAINGHFCVWWPAQVKRSGDANTGSALAIAKAPGEGAKAIHSCLLEWSGVLAVNSESLMPIGVFHCHIRGAVEGSCSGARRELGATRPIPDLKGALVELGGPLPSLELERGGYAALKTRSAKKGVGSVSENLASSCASTEIAVMGTHSWP